MRDKVAQSSGLEFTAMLAFAIYLSAGPMDVTTTVIPEDYMEAEPEDANDIVGYMRAENTRVRYSNVTVTTAKTGVTDGCLYTREERSSHNPSLQETHATIPCRGASWDRVYSQPIRSNSQGAERYHWECRRRVLHPNRCGGHQGQYSDKSP
jgi:hypothetical protein